MIKTTLSLVAITVVLLYDMRYGDRDQDYSKSHGKEHNNKSKSKNINCNKINGKCENTINNKKEKDIDSDSGSDDSDELQESKDSQDSQDSNHSKKLKDTSSSLTKNYLSLENVRLDMLDRMEEDEDEDEDNNELSFVWSLLHKS